MYFNTVKKKDKVYSLIYGEGEVKNVVDASSRIDGFYIFSVEYSEHKLVHYTADGIPNWCGDDCGTQTVFYKNDIDFERVDFKPSDDKLSIKKVKKLRGTGKLEMKCPSGLWRNADECPIKIITEAINSSKTYLFRMVDYIGKDRRSRNERD